jgi:hypothetical protein
MIAKLRALLAAATPGALVQGPEAELIVAAHNSLPALLDCVEAAKAMRDALEWENGLECFTLHNGEQDAFDAALKRLERAV